MNGSELGSNYDGNCNAVTYHHSTTTIKCRNIIQVYGIFHAIHFICSQKPLSRLVATITITPSLYIHPSVPIFADSACGSESSAPSNILLQFLLCTAVVGPQ